MTALSRTKAARSAPEKPVHFSDETSDLIDVISVGKIGEFDDKVIITSDLSSGVGKSIYNNLSNLPGLTIAGSIISGRLVAPITKTCLRDSKPSNSVSKVLTTRAEDSDKLSSLLGTRASNSSKKMTHGDEALALLKTCLIALSDSPTYLFNNSGPLTLMKFALLSLATAFASKVLPQPGGPQSKTPQGAFIPIISNNSGLRTG